MKKVTYSDYFHQNKSVSQSPMENLKFECVQQPATPCHPLFIYFLQFTHKEKQYQLQITPENFSSTIIEPENIKDILMQAFQNGPEFEESLEVHGAIETPSEETCTIFIELNEKITTNSKKTFTEEFYFFPEIVSCTEATIQTPNISNTDFQLLSYTELNYQQFKLKFTYENREFNSIVDSSTFQSNLISIDMLGHVLQEKNVRMHNIDISFQYIESNTLAINIELTPNGNSSKGHTKKPSESLVILCHEKKNSFRLDLEGKTYQKLFCQIAEQIGIELSQELQITMTNLAKGKFQMYVKNHMDSCLLDSNETYIDLSGENFKEFFEHMKAEASATIQIILAIIQVFHRQTKFDFHYDKFKDKVERKMKQIYGTFTAKINFLFDFCCEVKQIKRKVYGQNDLKISDSSFTSRQTTQITSKTIFYNVDPTPEPTRKSLRVLNRSLNEKKIFVNKNVLPANEKKQESVSKRTRSAKSKKK